MPATRSILQRCLAGALALAAGCGGPAPAPTQGDGLPTPRGGEHLLGLPLPVALPQPVASPAAAAAPLALRDERPLLVRFWTDGCPHCARTLPALEALRTQPARRAAFEVLAVHHPKPAAPALTPEALRARAAAVGYFGPLAQDPDWALLRSLVPDAGRDHPTSFSLLLDSTGAVRWFHPGPALHPSEAGDPALIDSDWHDLERALELLLAEAPV